MVKVLLEYDEYNINKCIVTCNNTQYETKFVLPYNKLTEFRQMLYQIYLEAFYNSKHEFLKTCNYKVYYWNIPIQLPVSVADVIDDTNSLDSVSFKILTIDLQKFYNLVVKLRLNDLNTYNLDHIFICKSDLKEICNSEDVPDTMFNGTIANMHVHYIPNINKSFIIDSYQLQM